MARGGKVVLISDAEGLAEAGGGCMATIEMHKVHPLIAPLVYAVPVQLLAYHVAVAKGTDVDQRPEEHTSELQSPMRIPYAVFCSKTNNKSSPPYQLQL